MSIQSQFSNLPNFVYPTLYTGENISNDTIYQHDKLSTLDKCYNAENQSSDNFNEQFEIDKTEAITQTIIPEESTDLSAIFQVSPSYPDVHNVTQLPFQFNDSTCLIGYSQPVNTDDLIMSMNSPMQIFQEYPQTVDAKDVSLLVPSLINYPQTTGLVSMPSDPSLQFVPGMLNYFQPVMSDDASMQINPQIHIVQGLINYSQPLQNNEIPTTFDPSMQIYQGNIIQQPCNTDYGNVLLDQYKANCVAIQPVYSSPTIQHVFIS